MVAECKYSEAQSSILSIFYKRCPRQEHFTDARNPLSHLLLLSYDKTTCKANIALLRLNRCSYHIPTLALYILVTWQAPHLSQLQRAGQDLPQAGQNHFQGSLATRTDTNYQLHGSC